MSSRKSTDSTSNSGVSYQSGAASTTGVAVKGVVLTQDIARNLTSLLGKNGAFNGHAVEIWADGAVYDTVSGAYLLPGRDYNPHDLQRT